MCFSSSSGGQDQIRSKVVGQTKVVGHFFGYVGILLVAAFVVDFRGGARRDAVT